MLFVPNVLQKKSTDKFSSSIDQTQMEKTSGVAQNIENNKQEEVLAEEEELLVEDITPLDIRFGVVVKNYSNNTGELTAVENLLGKTVSTVGIYKQFGLNTNRNLVESDLAYIKSSGKTLLLTWEPWNPNEGTSQSVDYLKEIIEGKHDDYISAFANQIKNYTAPVILRFAHEMNGNWYPWGNRPEEYISAYRKIVETFRNSGVTNVRFMWSINGDNVPYEPIGQSSKYYPGDGYVDMVGLDGYNFGTSRQGSTWKSFSQIFLPSYSFVSRTYPNKPIIISETASTEFGGNKTEWVEGMFSALVNMPKIEEIIWFNLLKETDWRIDSSQSSLESLKRNLNIL